MHLVRKVARDAAQPPGSIPWQWFDAEGEEEEQAEEDEAMEVEDQEGDEDQEGESTP